MQKISFGLLTGAAILAATALVYAQSATPIEGNPSVVRPAPPVSGAVVMPSTSGAAPNSAAPKTDGTAHMPAATPTGLLVPPKLTSLRPNSSSRLQ
jgi:hypothetical protein